MLLQCSSQSEKPAAKESRTWGITVEYRGAPVRPFRKGDGTPEDSRVKLCSMTVCGENQTRIYAEVTVDTEEEAREIGLARIQRHAHVLRLPAEPVSVTMRP